MDLIHPDYPGQPFKTAPTVGALRLVREHLYKLLVKERQRTGDLRRRVAQLEADLAEHKREPTPLTDEELRQRGAARRFGLL